MGHVGSAERRYAAVRQPNKQCDIETCDGDAFDCFRCWIVRCVLRRKGPLEFVPLFFVVHAATIFDISTALLIGRFYSETTIVA